MEREFYVSKDGTKVIIVAPIAELERIIDNMERLKYPHKNLLVIGNGFDLSLGLPTTYRNFVENGIFRKMYVKRRNEKIEKEKQTKVRLQPSLLDYLYGKKFCERWYDIEQALLEYVSIRPDGSFVNNVEEDKRDYELLCEALTEYLSSLFRGKHQLRQRNLMSKLPAGRLLKVINSSENIVYNFNYTPIEEALEAIYANSVKLHGKITMEAIFDDKIKDNSIILGIETDNNIAPGYTFLLKSNNPIYKSSMIAHDIQSSKRVIFFGHSLNQMDFGYFEDYFRTLMQNQDYKREVVFITKDEKTRLSLLDSIRQSGISIRDVFAHTKVEFILTENLKDKSSHDTKKFDKLLELIEKEKYDD